MPLYHGTIDYIVFDGNYLSKSPKPPIGDYIELKEGLFKSPEGRMYSWWDFAECLLGNHIVKPSLRQRFLQ